MVSLRFIAVPAWVAAAVYLAFTNPTVTAGSQDIVSLVPSDAPALAVAERAAREFQLPVSTEAAVVQRAPHGLSVEEQRRIVERAVRTDRGGGALFALPVLNTAGIVPGSRERSTTAITFLGFRDQSMSLTDRDRAAHAYAAEASRDPGGSVVGVTGIVPAKLHEGRLIEGGLPLIEAATVLIIIVVVGLMFRSLGAPLVTLTAVGAAYATSVAVLDRIGRAGSIQVPDTVRPLVIALVLGIVTDAAIFYLSAMRSALARGLERVPAARAAAAETTPILLASGLILAAGLAALDVARIRYFRELGPGLAVTVLVSLTVSVTLVPAALGLFGRLLYWPRRLPTPPAPADSGAPRPLPLVARLRTHRAVAFLLVAACAAGLGVAAARVQHMRLGFTPITGLPADSEERRAADAAAQGFAPGILAPTQVLVEQTGIAGRTSQLIGLEQLIGRQPGVAGVIGPREQPTGSDVATSRNGNAARYLVILDTDPYGAVGIDRLRSLRAAMPRLVDQVGLSGARIGLAGDTALAMETMDTMRGDLVRIAAVVLAVNLLMLMLFLRAVVAPLFLVAASVLGVAAALGLTELLFRHVLGHPQITYFVPFAVAVLLVSLGSDYNVFIVGRLWQEAQVRSLREAVAIATPRAARAIRNAGLTLAASFALLAIVPLLEFREFAAAMTIGILLETFVVRSLLAPALVVLFGHLSGWPGKRLRPPARATRPHSAPR